MSSELSERPIWHPAEQARSRAHYCEVNGNMDDAEVHHKSANAIDALTAERDAAVALALKAFTVVEWVAGEGFVLKAPHYDADDLLLEMTDKLNVEDSEAARNFLKDHTNDGDDS